MGLLSRLRHKKPRSRLDNFGPAHLKLKVQKYDLIDGKVVCRNCQQSHDYFAYLCRGCGTRLLDYARDEDLAKFWAQFPPQIRPDRTMWLCKCGIRYRRPNARCRSCRTVTGKVPAYPLPNFEFVDQHSIRCGKCLRTMYLRRKLQARDKCKKCDNSLLVSAYCRDFTIRRPVVGVSFDGTLDTPAIKRATDEANKKYRKARMAKVHRVDFTSPFATKKTKGGI